MRKVYEQFTFCVKAVLLLGARMLGTARAFGFRARGAVSHAEVSHTGPNIHMLELLCGSSAAETLVDGPPRT